MASDDSVIFIGDKQPMNYVLAVITQFQNGATEVFVKARGRETLGEEAPEAYKDVDEVVNVVHQAGISLRVARMKPLSVMKG